MTEKHGRRELRHFYHDVAFLSLATPRNFAFCILQYARAGLNLKIPAAVRVFRSRHELTGVTMVPAFRKNKINNLREGSLYAGLFKEASK